MKIYTKTGDDGETGLFAGPRVSKDDLRIEAYGAVDELNAVLGVARSHRSPVELDEILSRVQHELFLIGAELATPEPSKLGMTLLGAAQVTALEQAIDRLEESLPPLTQFVLPGGTAAAAAIHVARTVCRRAERRVVTLRRTAQVSDSILHYLNRLSDLLFVMARSANRLAGEPDIPWQSPR